MLSELAVEKVCFIIVKAREYDVAGGEPSDDASNPSDDRFVSAFTPANEKTTRRELTAFINAAYSGIWIHTFEPDEAEREILQHARQQKWKIAVWDVANGLRMPGTSGAELLLRTVKRRADDHRDFHCGWSYGGLIVISRPLLRFG